MRQVAVFVLITAVVNVSGSICMAQSVGVPQSYSDFTGIGNGLYQINSVYGDFNGDSFLDHVITDPENGFIVVYLSDRQNGVCHSNNYFVHLDMINPVTYGIYDYPRFPLGHFANDPEPNCHVILYYFDFEDLNGVQNLGDSLAVGDFNADGIDDLAIGAPAGTLTGGPSESGTVTIMWGSGVFPDTTDVTQLWQGKAGTWGVVHDTPEAGDRFGATLAVGDFDCNGTDDLAVGAPLEDLVVSGTNYQNAGMVHVFYTSTAFGFGFSSTAQFRQNLMTGQTVANFEYFGASMTAGHFNGASQPGIPCDGLAIGAPGEDYNAIDKAGEVYVFHAAAGDVLRPTRAQVINQATGTVYDNPEQNDMFGSTLGTEYVSQGQEGLWIGLVNWAFVHRHDFVACTDEEQIAFHRLSSNASGIIITGTDRHNCGLFLPRVAEQRGVISQLSTECGSVAFYMPIQQTAAGVGALIHGTFGDEDDPPECTDGSPMSRFAGNNGYYNEIADGLGIAMVTPLVDHDHFGNRSICALPEDDYQMQSGYRGTFGACERNSNGAPQLWGFDEWLNFIMDELEKINTSFGQPMYLYGHSAGGQFVSRYLWEHAERVNTAVISSAGSFLWNTNAIWNNGMEEVPDETSYYQSWPAAPALTYYPFDPEDMTSPAGDFDGRWADILNSTDIHVVVESTDLAKVSTHTIWVNAVNAIPGVTNTATLCVLNGANHGTIFDGVYGLEVARELFGGFALNSTGRCSITIP